MVRRKKKTGLVTKIHLCWFAIYATVTLVSLQVQIGKQQEKINTLNAAITSKELSNAEIQESLDIGLTDETIAKAAREKFKYVSPGERIFKPSN